MGKKVMLTENGISYVIGWMESEQDLEDQPYGEMVGEPDPIDGSCEIRLSVRDSEYSEDDDDAFIWFLYNDEFSVVEDN